MALPVGDDTLEALTPKEVGARLRCSEKTVRRMIASGRLGHVLVGERGVRVAPHQLAEFLATGAPAVEAL